MVSLFFADESFNAARDIIEPFHQFIYRFLSCEECGKNFHYHISKVDLSNIVRPGLFFVHKNFHRNYFISHKVIWSNLWKRSIWLEMKVFWNIIVPFLEQGILWLWMAHNKINKRLSMEDSNDPVFSKRQFPPPSLCPICQTADGNYNEEKTLKFLIEYYSNIKTDFIEVVFDAFFNNNSQIFFNIISLISFLILKWIFSQCLSMKLKNLRKADFKEFIIGDQVRNWLLESILWIIWKKAKIY